MGIAGISIGGIFIAIVIHSMTIPMFFENFYLLLSTFDCLILFLRPSKRLIPVYSCLIWSVK